MRPPFWYQLALKVIQPLYRSRIRKRATDENALQQELLQRFGPFSSPKHTHSLWFHAVSVGETNAAQPLIEHYLAQGQSVLVTNTTKTGQARAKALFEKKYPDLFQAVFLPADLRENILQFLACYQPKLVLLMETELWPNLLSCLHEQGIATLLLNARLSAKSAQGYARFKRLTVPMLQQLNWIAAQDQATLKRFESLGKDAQCMQVLGNIKFDIHAPEWVAEKARTLYTAWQLQQRKVLVLASTHAPEEQQLVQALCEHFKQDQSLLCIVVPRHPERFDAVFSEITQLGLSVKRRSLQQVVDADTQVYLADSMGELWLWYALAQVAYVGGSLNEPGGGHNILEPIALGVATVLGKNYFNFQTIVDEFVEKKAVEVVDTPTQAAERFIDLLQQQAQGIEMMAQADAVFKQNQGSLQRHIALIDRFLAQS
ncbi:3-deoxy-D-manno-octulosonic acid transferase [Acinetobacter rathckeae]|uniref:3-deoxy-D-manno-octulosonic acid transferase n=1 Tax=Acinetobacter rathckeae TaxID=2605272 RepID=UPI0018A2E242|nr:3-deoxy-D-manno-octulosonic acid transferase [Acinetobacter rathckeae]MBF7688202.1 3-deoxy-D-manno-octulosonic acid transferase [Acinetobacter rathckeae]